MTLHSFLKLTPEYRDYVWGGNRLRPGHNPTAEAWMIWENDQIETGILAGKSLGQATVEFGPALVGEKAFARTGTRFPLLIKILDCAQWLSLQVHPNDMQAIQLEGPGQFGKTEAWHILEAQPESTLISGLKSNAGFPETANAILNGTITKYVQYATVSQGDTILMPAGTLHALGPGLLIYEVQQTSDWTYRVYDWDRPQTASRPLHIDKSIQVTHPGFAAPIISIPAYGDGTVSILTACEYFTLELLAAASQPIELDTYNETFHTVTMVEGKARLYAGDESMELEKFQTALIPSSLGKYQFQPLENCRALKSSV